MIRLMDLGTEYRKIKQEIDKGIREIVDAQQFTDGGHITDLRKSLRDISG